MPLAFPLTLHCRWEYVAVHLGDAVGPRVLYIPVLQVRDCPVLYILAENPEMHRAVHEKSSVLTPISRSHTNRQIDTGNKPIQPRGRERKKDQNP
ncbi:hypothetical protein VTK73DRAFT_5995 [Phialemonium thermophilum]|uniref:Uncharacterized protein n=1 Tax=Phialemonium thermophilum TaxID=223376 RepID=A0ABR3V1F0_9PEZI